MLEFIRGIVRPTLTWAGFGALVAMLLLGIESPEWFRTMVAMMISFWFAQRKPSG
jgi:hypothetical protein